MLQMLTLAAIMIPAAPLPRTPEAPAGQPPVIMNLKPDADGKIRVTVLRTEKRKINAVAGNGRNVQQIDREVSYSTRRMVELQEVKDLTASTTDGKPLDIKDVLQRLSGGGIVLASSDGEKVSPHYLKLFRDDVIVLVSPEFKGMQATPTTRPGLINGPNQVQPLPAQVQPLPAQVPRGIQIQIQGIGAAPAIVPAAPAPAPADPIGK